ncbi:MAG TPA: ABC transporter permease [Verrucomicrobiae bacterium]|nr:ABC transporter permease [Verrucomicrobiae bacterium]
MNIRYATLLATTKFRTRLGRSIVTVVAASLVASIMLVASFVSTGIENALKNAGNPAMASLNLVQESIYTFPELKTGVGGSVEAQAPPAHTLEQYRELVKDEDATAIYQEVGYGSFTLLDPVPPAATISDPMRNSFSSSAQVGGRSKDLFILNLATNPPAAVTGTIPALVNRDFILWIEDVTFSDSDTASFKVTKTREVLDRWLGRTMTLERAESDGTTKTPLKVTVQGFLTSSGLFGGGDQFTILTPLEEMRVAMGSAAPDPSSPSSFFLSFPSEASKTAYIEKITKAGNFAPGTTSRFAHSFGDPMYEFRELRDGVTSVLKYILIGLLAAVALAMLTTLSKIIADSERETGVFRAIGAKASDIVQLYVTYSAFIAILGMLVALAIASLLALYLTARFGETLGYQIVSISGSNNLNLRVTLLGLDPSHLLGVFGAILGASILGTLLPLYSLLRKDPITALRSE